ncbi:MAG: Jag N-terminal domain-containing protein [Acidimicrobiia bacterium]|nr:Jag N-terminal domain-containing protein [Acidimicrobiia bacterium]
MEVEWVEVHGKTVDIAVGVALEELGISDRELADIEVIDEGVRGTLGFGKKDAIVRVKPKPMPKKRRRRTRKPREGEAIDSRENSQTRQNRPNQRSGQGGQQQRSSGNKRQTQNKPQAEDKEKIVVNRDEQADVVRDFLNGLLKAFGLEGDVQVVVEDDAVVAQVFGDQTEALVGERAVILQAVLELTRTVVQRQTHDGVRIRLDIAGYRERRREALAIYAERLGQRVLEDGAELQLEPMNAADRKVIHDSVAEIAGIRSYSEGEEPRRFVVLGPDGSVAPSDDEDTTQDGDDDGADDDRSSEE